LLNLDPVNEIAAFPRSNDVSRRIGYATLGAAAIGLILFMASGGASSGSQAPHAPAIQVQQHASVRTMIKEAGPLPSAIAYRQLDERLQRLAQEQQMVGLAVGIVEDGELRFIKGYGDTGSGSPDPVTPDTVFRWASLSKGVAADMVSKLAEEGRLSLDAPVDTYAASLRLPGGNEARATVIDLLSHRLGLYEHANESKLEDGADPRFLRRSLATLNAICAPGTCHAYQNVAYDAASEIVEKVTGLPYQRVVEEQLFQPLGMRSASVTRAGLEGSKSWARPHQGGKGSKPLDVLDTYYRIPAAGGINSSIKDLAIWMQAQMGEAPDVLPRKVLADVQAPRAATPVEQGRMRKFRERVLQTRYGLGWRIYDYAGHTVICHRGGVSGYRSLIMFDPVKKSGVVALWNSPSNQPGGLEFEVMDMVYRLPSRDWMGLDGAIARAEPRLRTTARV
jgi:beta-lactamase class C